MTEHKNIGSSFASFLADEGLAEDVADHAAEAVLAWQFERETARQEERLFDTVKKPAQDRD